MENNFLIYAMSDRTRREIINFAGLLKPISEKDIGFTQQDLMAFKIYVASLQELNSNRYLANNRILMANCFLLSLKAARKGEDFAKIQLYAQALHYYEKLMAFKDKALSNASIIERINQLPSDQKGLVGEIIKFLKKYKLARKEMIREDRLYRSWFLLNATEKAIDSGDDVDLFLMVKQQQNQVIYGKLKKSQYQNGLEKILSSRTINIKNYHINHIQALEHKLAEVQQVKLATKLRLQLHSTQERLNIVSKECQHLISAFNTQDFQAEDNPTIHALKYQSEKLRNENLDLQHENIKLKAEYAEFMSSGSMKQLIEDTKLLKAVQLENDEMKFSFAKLKERMEVLEAENLCLIKGLNEKFPGKNIAAILAENKHLLEQNLALRKDNLHLKVTIKVLNDRINSLEETSKSQEEINQSLMQQVKSVTKHLQALQGSVSILMGCRGKKAKKQDALLTSGHRRQGEKPLDAKLLL